MRTPFYDPAKTYYENFEHGPFGDFADPTIIPASKPRFTYLGKPISYPFGIAAGPLINGAFVKAALNKGFDVCVYKTVRSQEKKCNEWPNVLPVVVEGDLTLEQAAKGLTVKGEYTTPLAITNSFGNPSYTPDFWQKDARALMSYAKSREGQMVCGMVEGTRWSESATEQDFIDDWVKVSRLMVECDVDAIEVNFSCPNEGDRVKRLLCYDAGMSARIVKAVKQAIGTMPLVVKISYFENESELRDLISQIGSLVQGIATINTIAAPVYKPDGTQALPGGPWRLKSGVCGRPIKWAGLEMVKRLKALRGELGFSYDIVGVGGVTTPQDFKEYRDAGADVVMSATAAMWNGYLAKEIKEAYPNA